MKRQIGYWWVKFYNHERPRICYFNGEKFEAFKSDFVHDEIEQVIMMISGHHAEEVMKRKSNANQS